MVRGARFAKLTPPGDRAYEYEVDQGSIIGESEGAPPILYVDEDSTARRTFSDIVKRFNLKVDLASDFEEASSLAATTRYGIVLSGLLGEGGSSLQPIKVLHDEHPTTCFMLVTDQESANLPPDVPESQLVSEILFKPWNTGDVLSALRRGFGLHKSRLRASTKKVEQVASMPDGLLVIDDDPKTTALISGFLENTSLRFEICTTSADAIFALKNDRFDVALTSMTSASFHLDDLLHEMVAITPHLAIITIGGEDERGSLVGSIAMAERFHLDRNTLDSQVLTSSIWKAFNSKQSQSHFEKLTQYDRLTGLANRLLFRKHLEALLQLERPATKSLGVLIAGLDRFKDFNETLGRDVGDLLLQAVADRLQHSTKRSEMVARLAGDQFAIVLEQLNNSNDAAIVAKRILQSLSKPLKVAGQEYFVTASVGIATCPPSEKLADSLMKDAETAMYKAKGIGRNRYRVHMPEMNKQAAVRLSLENELGVALENEQFELYYQPVISMEDDRLVGAEALLRWNHPERGQISPAVFIAPLEETGLIVPVGEWVIKTACRQNKAWQDAGLPSLVVAVNIAAIQFQEEYMQKIVSEALEQSGLDPAHLHLEITESALLDESSLTRTSLQEIRNMGVKISLDDFGTGYSSLRYLKRYPINTLKIDRSFVRDITSDPDDAAIVKAIIALGKSLRLDLVAEGIETQEQLDFLKDAKCDKYQGYYCSKPMPNSEFMEWVKNRLASSD